MNHWRIYPPPIAVAVTPHGDAFPRETTLHVFADVGDEPEVGFDIDGVCLVSIKLGDARTLRLDRLDDAIAQFQAVRTDLIAAARRAPLLATGTEGRCESCSLPVRAGEAIVVEDEGGEDRVVLHAGRCPGEERADVAAAGSN